MTKAEWMQEEEERLIRMEQDIDAITGSHRAHCDVCWDGGLPGYRCEMEDLLARASALITKATRLNQQRQDEIIPLPHYVPALGGSRADGPVLR